MHLAVRSSWLPYLRRHWWLPLLLVVVLLAAASCFIPGPQRQGAEIVISPDQRLNQAGETWTATIQVNSNQPVNSVDTTIHFDPNLVDLESVDNKKSDFELTVLKPHKDQKAGTVRFTQTSLTPHQGLSHLGSIEFKGIRQGRITLDHTDTKIIAHNGQGTNVYQDQLDRSLGQWLMDTVSRQWRSVEAR